MTDQLETAPIWLTYKARMNSERRLQGQGLIAHLAISWYSFLLIVFGVFQPALDQTAGPTVGPLAIVLSVLVFGLSLIFYGFRFEQRAAQFRECYLALQRLYRSDATPSQKMEKYAAILDQYPNHEEMDYEKVVFESWRRGSEIYNTKGAITANRGLIARGYAKAIGWWIFIGVVFLGPIITAKWFL
jgi:hypothetical protein